MCTAVVVAGALYALYRFAGGKPRPGTGAYDPATGLGRGAPGFRMCLFLTPETNVRQVALPADLVARIRAGEQVSAEEITAAQARVAAGEPTKPTDEWVPASAKKNTSKNRRGKK